MKKIDSLNLVPFIDIMLVLLVIVLVSASFTTTSQLPIQIPKIDEDSSVRADIKQVNIALDKSGNIYVDSQPVDRASLFSYLRSLDIDTNIILKADKDASVQYFIDIMSALQFLGLTKVFTEVELDY
ncbi:biopolymer transporter ExbD [Helicobacter muridarum]|uniref:Biopolymer transport protein ExbD/TolR n=1 Tax=Helicobacter muridarum TaxID=216 RepID=A0A099U1P9_9HELI|nr:biopolymer transporter ExbD [Helicobacter muridarum]TLE00772.1 biopolymer transporter ExbD [Helicobacter muridarum]STQ86547.1 Biopolymer transport protein ExbD/TolR [Helicobacter muridarum]